MREKNLAEEWTGLRADYDAAQSSRFQRQRTRLGGAADAHLGSDAAFWKLREYARDMVRNDGVLGQAVKRAVTNIMRTGFDLECQTGDKGLDQELWQLFSDWAGDKSACSSRGLHTFRRLGEMALFSEFVDGDIFALPLDNGRLQLVEGENCLTPSNTTRRVIYGVYLDEDDRPKEYWFGKISRDNPNVRNVSDITRYPAFNDDGSPAVLHLLRADRVSATRGVTAFAPVFNLASMFDDLNFAKLVQAQVVSCIAAFLETDGVAPFGPQQNTSEGAVDGGLTDLVEEKLRPGLIKRLKPGEKIHPFSPNVPNAEYYDHVRLLLRIIGANLGLPLTLVLLDTTNTTFHGYRGELQQAQLGFEVKQTEMKENWFSPVYRWKTNWFVAKRKLKGPAVQKAFADGSLFRHRWGAPAWPYVNPLQDAKADECILANRLNSPRGLLATRGRDYDDVLAETVADNKALIAAAAQAAAELGAEAKIEVTWRDVLNPGAAAKPAGAVDPNATDPSGDEDAPPQKNTPPKPAQEAA